MEYDAPPNSLKDSNANPKMKTMEGVAICSLTHNISRVKGLCESSRMKTRTSDKQINFSYQSTVSQLIVSIFMMVDSMFKSL